MKIHLLIKFVIVLTLTHFDAGLLLAQKVVGKVLELGTKREIFIDHYLIEKMDGVQLVLNKPVDKGVMIRYDKPWETYAPAYVTILKDGDLYRAYYRAGKREGLKAYTNDEWTCYAESKNGIDWVKPELGLFDFNGSKANNIVIANEAPIHHNFSPFIDKNPKCKPEQKYKALGGTSRDGIGLIPYYSADAIHWKKMNSDGVIKKGAFDSQNVSFWSESEGKYVCYFRTFTAKARVRTVSRTTSNDFIHWTAPVEMTYGDTPFEHLYIQQTSPYFRAPHIYVAIGARLLPDRKIATTEQLTALQVDPTQHKGLSEPYLMTTRGDSTYDRTFMEAFIRPSTGLNNWSARSNFPALNVVQTGAEEMSLYVNQDYTQPTSHLHRYAMRLDGFSSINAPYKGGEVLTKPFTFTGKELEINYSTAAAGDIQIEIQDMDGKPVAGFSLNDCQQLIGNELARTVTWGGKSDLGKLMSKPVRLRIHMKDADLFSVRFK